MHFDEVINCVFFIYSKDFDEKIIQEPAESVTLTDNDYESTDSWLMKKHDGKQILEIFNGDAVVEEDIDRINYHNDGNAGNPNGNFKFKTGEEAPSSVREIVNIIKFSQYSQKVTESKSIFAIVSAMEKLFIVPVR